MHSVEDVVFKVAVGSQGKLAARSNLFSDLEVFRNDVAALVALEADGVVAILEKHPENQTGKRYIDFVTFTRLR